MRMWRFCKTCEVYWCDETHECWVCGSDARIGQSSPNTKTPMDWRPREPDAILP